MIYYIQIPCEYGVGVGAKGVINAVLCIQCILYIQCKLVEKEKDRERES